MPARPGQTSRYPTSLELSILEALDAGIEELTGLRSMTSSTFWKA